MRQLNTEPRSHKGRGSQGAIGEQREREEGGGDWEKSEDERLAKLGETAAHREANILWKEV